jgi:hypothetical protein
MEYDYNPFILFSSNGKILSLNGEAQFLLSGVSTREIFELATSYANVSFGFKTTFIDLEFGRYKFFGLTVGYQNEEEVGIKLYQSPSFKINQPDLNGDLTNIYTLIDLCISTQSINSKIKFEKDFDPTIPDIIINANHIIKTLNKVYNCFKENETILTKVFYRIGEHIKFNENKYSLFSIQVSAKNKDALLASQIQSSLHDNNFYIDIGRDITINIPMITSA